MKHLFSAYPAGSAGIALLLLRASLALYLASQLTPDMMSAAWPSLILGILALAIMAGLYMRGCALAAVAVIAIMSAPVIDAALVSPLTHALNALALALIGPGAFSADARLFGRSTINLPR